MEPQTQVRRTDPAELPDLLADASSDTLRAVIRAVAAMHAPRCPWCHPQPPRWQRWRHRAKGPCQTARVILAQLRTANVTWTST